MNAFYKIFNNPLGKAFFLHSTNALWLRGMTPFNTGYLMKDYIQATGAPYMVSSTYCINIPGPGSNNPFMPSGTVTWGAMPSLPVYGDRYNLLLNDDITSVIGIQSQDLALYQLYNPGCATPPTPAIPLPIPSIK